MARDRAAGGWWVRAALGLALLLLALPARAEDGASPWFETDQGKVRLIAASPETGGSATVELGLEFRLAPHWKIYWRSPGDAGFPPRLDWTGSTNLADAQIQWPAPRRFSVQGLETLGYTDTVVLPIRAQLARPGAPLELHAALSYLTCAEICVPWDTVLSLALPVHAGAAHSSVFAATIARAAAHVPGDGRAAGLELRSASLVPVKPALLELRVKTATPLLAPDAFPEGPNGVAFGAPRLAQDDIPGEALLRLPVFGDRAAIDALVGHPLSVTLVDGERALEATVTPEAAPPPADFGWLLSILPLALLGGLLLNVMPCVLPVLSIKLLSVAGQGGKSRGAVRLGFIATAAGVLLSFLALAGVMVALKSAGLAVGWGMQFQEPLFLIGMVALLTLFAANLWGFFEVPLPQWLAGLASAGEGHVLLGNVATGAFATLLATPCSAPFLGTAIGFALAAGPAQIFVVFLALGIGLASPYLLVALMPRLVLWLPKPGRWMLGLRRVLGLALAGTALWLLSVLVAQTGWRAALAVGALMAGAAAALWLLRAPQARRAVPAALFAAAFLVPALLSAPPPAGAADAFWQPFDQAAIDRLVGEGHVVFVDVTAEWCLTCKLNKELVIAAPDVNARLMAPGVVAMRADWTRPSDVIAAYLRGFGRYGIPFNAVYGPHAPHGLALSEILTSDQVLAALGQAAGPGRVAGTAAASPAAAGQE
jgi:suppressor for copper-sensitivity B